MTSSTLRSDAFEQTSRRVLPFLLVLFVGSGICALIYEVVWFQLLELVIGSSAVSLGVLLATFMGGMCIGSLALPRFASRARHPLQLYAMLELSIGLIGVVELFAIPLIGRLYSPAVGHGAAAIVLRAVVAALCLLPPTILMGATLPAIARWVESSPRGISWLGFFYGGNIAGAVVGSVLAGFYLLRVHDQAVATYVAAALNIAVALIAWGISTRTPAYPAGDHARGVSDSAAITANAPREGANAVYLAIGLSGACALAAEVIWTRLLSLTFGASVYTFSMILAVFLTGLGIGSATAAWLARIVESPRRALAWCQALLTVAIAWAAAVIFLALPNWPVNPSLAPSAWYALQLDLVRGALAILPAAVLWGASFPFALAAIAAPGEDTSRLVGRVYAANTVGSIVGATVCSLLLIPALGTRDAQRVLIAVAASASMLLLLAPGAKARLALLATPLLAALLIATVPELPGNLVAHGRYAVTWIGKTDVLYVGEGMNSSVAVTRVLNSGATQFHVSGKVEASSLPQDMRLQKMLAHLPALVHPNPQSVLVVGFGAGVTAGSFLPYPSVTRLVICEIEPLIPQVVSTWFVKENNNVAKDPRTQIYFDDARSFVQTSDEQFDVITSDPINPWVKGAASLYTREYFQAVKAHLKPGGVVTQWVPLYESTLDAVRSELATFFEVFPDGTIWANNLNGAGYDVVLLGQAGPSRIDIASLETRFQDAGYRQVGASLTESGFGSPMELFSTYAGSGADLKAWLSGAAINTDRNLRLQYLAGVGLNQYTAADIFEEIAALKRFPEQLFVASDAWKVALSQGMGVPR
ncbi:MAG: fused MFS/spermidine synthase [Gemmatimonadaceae bacterium]|nr:fused MFS/spermidine synthase [Gemmatimonadaceae bacterium]